MAHLRRPSSRDSETDYELFEASLGPDGPQGDRERIRDYLHVKSLTNIAPKEISGTFRPAVQPSSTPDDSQTDDHISEQHAAALKRLAMDESFPLGIYALAYLRNISCPDPCSSPVSGPDDIPRKEEVRDPTNLYTPHWIKGKGANRQGWCGLCQPGRWRYLRKSEYRYDKLYRHGINVDGDLLPRPKQTRKAESVRGWESLCPNCGAWIYLRRAEATWFRHIEKCAFRGGTAEGKQADAGETPSESGASNSSPDESIKSS